MTVASSSSETLTLRGFKQWGNSAVVRIPKLLLQGAGLSIKSPIDINLVDGRIVVEPVREPEYSLDALLAGITPDNLHDEVDFGEPVGKEVA